MRLWRATDRRKCDISTVARELADKPATSCSPDRALTSSVDTPTRETGAIKIAGTARGTYAAPPCAAYIGCGRGQVHNLDDTLFLAEPLDAEP